jgi:hypothetical protein
MAESSAAGREPASTGWPGLAPLEAMASLNKRALAVILEFNGSVYSRMAAINSEWAEFVGKRFTEEFKLSQQLAACRNPDQLLQVYSAFIKLAFEQYQAEFAHMLKLGQTFATQNADFLKDRVEAAMKDAPQPERAGKLGGVSRRHLDSVA